MVHSALLRRLVTLLLAIVLLQLAPRVTSAAKPRLQFTGIHGYQLAFEGAGWGSHAHVTLRFSQNDTVQHLTVIAASTGGFTVGANEVNPCADVTVTAHDRAGHRARLARPERGCPTPIEIHPARLTLLEGQLARKSTSE